MSERINKNGLVQKVAARLGEDPAVVSRVVDGVLEEIYEALKREECVSLKGFGTFYVQSKRESWVFKFNPAQRLRALFGWSSSYKGEL